MSSDSVCFMWQDILNGEKNPLQKICVQSTFICKDKLSYYLSHLEQHFFRALRLKLVESIRRYTLKIGFYNVHMITLKKDILSIIR